VPIRRPSPWAHFWAVARPVFRSPAGRPVGGLLAVLLVLLLCVSGLNVVNSYVGRDFMTAVADRDADHYLPLAARYLAVFALSTVVAVFNHYTEERLGLLWRRWLTGHFVERYFAGGAYRRVVGRPDLDNPDQRMTEDIRTFTTFTLSLLLILLNSTITLIAFCGVLWSLTPWLVLAAAGYAAAGTALAILLGRPLVGLDYRQLQLEADLRAELMKARTEAEAGTLASGEGPEARVGGRLAAVVANFKRVIAVNRNLGFFTTGYNYLIQLLPVLIMAPLFMRGEVEFGMVTQAAMAFAHVVGAFSLIVTEFGRISAFAAVVNRLGALDEALDGPAKSEPVTPAAPEAAAAS
jgi:putative ATP-binding cassette transporter